MGFPKDMDGPYTITKSHSQDSESLKDVWEACMGSAYHKGVSLLGVSGITLDIWMFPKIMVPPNHPF